MHSFGICTLAALSMRTEPSDKSELCNQLLFGELYTTHQLSENGKWLYIETEWDNYKGWISALSHREVSEAYFVRYRLGIHAITLEPIGKAFLQKQPRLPILLPYSSTLPFWDKRNIDLGIAQAQSTTKAQVGKGENKHHIWLQGITAYLNAPYLWGGRTPLGIDCSGFTQNLYKPLGIRLERDAYLQAKQGITIPFTNAQTGNLAFFEREGRIVHVGMVLSHKDAMSFDVSLPKDKKLAIVHALDTVRIDALDAQGIFHLQHTQYTHTLSHIQAI
jgi:gamma-D-glutamyl-L-lysine dipeptidyl-peptidase